MTNVDLEALKENKTINKSASEKGIHATLIWQRQIMIIINHDHEGFCKILT